MSWRQGHVLCLELHPVKSHCSRIHLPQIMPFTFANYLSLNCVSEFLRVSISIFRSNLSSNWKQYIFLYIYVVLLFDS